MAYEGVQVEARPSSCYLSKQRSANSFKCLAHGNNHSLIHSVIRCPFTPFRHSSAPSLRHSQFAFFARALSAQKNGTLIAMPSLVGGTGGGLGFLGCAPGVFRAGGGNNVDCLLKSIKS